MAKTKTETSKTELIEKGVKKAETVKQTAKEEFRKAASGLVIVRH